MRLLAAAIHAAVLVNICCSMEFEDPWLEVEKGKMFYLDQRSFGQALYNY